MHSSRVSLSGVLETGHCTVSSQLRSTFGAEYLSRCGNHLWAKKKQIKEHHDNECGPSTIDIVSKNHDVLPQVHERTTLPHSCRMFFFLLRVRFELLETL